MTGWNIKIEPVCETSLMLHLGDVIDVALASVIGRISQRIQSECAGVCELTPSYTTILIETNTINQDMNQLSEEVLEIAQEEKESTKSNRKIQETRAGKLIELPVYYHREVGLDLDAVAEYGGLTVEEVIAIHSGRDYTVCAIGFAPGFAFLADVDECIAMPRHDRPRVMVSAGSVGIAERQTAVYPACTPGGWQIVGNCPVPLFSPLEDPMSPFEIGDKVRFLPVDRQTYLKQGGHV